MHKNLPAKTDKPKKHRSIEEIRRDPAAWAKLNALVDEAVNCKTRIAGEQQNIKGLRDSAMEDIGLKPALFNKHVAVLFNNDYQQRRENLEEEITLIEILEGATPTLTHDE